MPILRCQSGVAICTSSAGTLKTGMTGISMTVSQPPKILTRKSTPGRPGCRFPLASTRLTSQNCWEKAGGAASCRGTGTLRRACVP